MYPAPAAKWVVKVEALVTVHKSREQTGFCEERMHHRPPSSTGLKIRGASSVEKEVTMESVEKAINSGMINKEHIDFLIGEIKRAEKAISQIEAQAQHRIALRLPRDPHVVDIHKIAKDYLAGK